MKTKQSITVAEIKFNVAIVPIKQRSLPLKGFDAGARHYQCTLTRAEWDSVPYTLEYSQGSGVKEDPSAKRIIQAVVSDALDGTNDFDEFCGAMGFDTNSRSAFASWEACKATGDALARMGIEEDELYVIAELLEATEA